MSTFLIRSATSQSSSYPIVLTRLGGPRSRPNPQSLLRVLYVECNLCIIYQTFLSVESDLLLYPGVKDFRLFIHSLFKLELFLKFHYKCLYHEFLKNMSKSHNVFKEDTCRSSVKNSGNFS